MGLLFIIFVFGFFVATSSWLISERYRQTYISVATALFYFYSDWVAASILGVATILTFYLSKRDENALSKVSIAILVLVFILVKSGQNMEGYKSLFSLMGFSFYMFRLLHLNLERWKGNLKRTTLQEWLNYLYFLPLILVGPLERFENFSKQIKRKRWNSSMFSEGLERLLYGWAKIVILGSYFFSTQFENWFPFFREHSNWLREYGNCLKYAGNAYFQFAGYSDIAIGLALLMGIRIKENFNYPFLANSVSDFWRRWHISLSEWCRDYIYTPIASKTRKPFWGVIASMLILGLWHEFTFRYVLWGLVHGIGIVVWKLADSHLGRYIPNPKVKTAISTVFTFNFVIISFACIKDATFYATTENLKILLFLQ